jgi:predicted TIM-barrel fold metal-dependent hydrolase
MSLSYGVLWNGLKKIASKYSGDERESLFAGTAERVYRLDT